MTQHYGYTYNYTSKNITDKDYICKLPDWFDDIINKITNTNLIKRNPDQIIINRYLLGEGIASHVDKTEIFRNQIYSVSLSSGTTINFKKGNKTCIIYVPRRAFLLMENDARYKYTHGIDKRKTHTVKVNGIKKERQKNKIFNNI